MPTFPLPTLACTVDATGISAPPYDQIYTSLQATYQGIFGTDSYIAPDSQDGQLLAVMAKAISDCNTTAIFVYNNYGPATAQGAGLSSAVKMNGLHRRVSSKSTVDALIVGQVGITIVNGIIGDQNGQHKWNLPAAVTIPPAGDILVTATCQDDGAIAAAPNTLTKIITPTLGWQTVTNPTEAAPGNPVESDAQLRRRQSQASSLPADSALSAVFSGLWNLATVTDLAIHENYTGSTDSAGVPQHSIAVVIVGGDVDQIAATIALKKSPGSSTFGDISILTTDPNGLPITIDFARPVDTVVNVVLNVTAKAGYSTDITALEVSTMQDFLNAMHIGVSLDFNELWPPALLAGMPEANTFKLTGMTANGGTADIAVPYNGRIVAGSVTVNVA